LERCGVAQPKRRSRIAFRRGAGINFAKENRPKTKHQARTSVRKRARLIVLPKLFSLVLRGIVSLCFKCFTQLRRLLLQASIVAGI
jgi:hypothetical protein